MRAELNNGKLFTSRRPKIEKSAACYTTCPYCFAPLAKSGLSYHVKYKCRHAPVSDERTDGERVTTSLATAVEARHHEDASPALQNVFKKFRDCSIVRDIKFDWMATVYGNKLTAKYTKRNSPEMIRNRMRLIGRVLAALKNIEPNITDLAGLLFLNITIVSLNQSEQLHVSTPFATSLLRQLQHQVPSLQFDKLVNCCSLNT